MNMTLSQELQWRGFVNQTTLKDLKELDEKKFKLYFGVDPSADSMTVGNLAAAMMVRAFIKHGHDVTLLVGGATGMIGDPSGKDKERSLLTLEQVEENKKGIAAQYKNIFKNQDFRLVDNYDWFKDIGYLEFLRDAGKHFSMTPLLQRDYIANRIGPEGGGITYAEFSYTLIQGYDFYHLHQQYGVDMQVCGSDQWGNSISGVDLVRRKTGDEVHVYSAPLIINKATGKKFGKSEEGAVWLDPKKTSVYRFYQFWLNADDEGVEDYMKVFTELSKEEIDSVMKKFNDDRSSRLAQKTLAYEVTKLVHGTERAESVLRVSEVLFGGADYRTMKEADFEVLAEELRVVEGQAGALVLDMVRSSGLAQSKSEANRFLEQGAVYINGAQVRKDKPLRIEDTLDGKHIIVRRGKNAHALLKLS